MKNKIKNLIISIISTVFILGAFTTCSTTGEVQSQAQGYYPLRIVNKAANSKNVTHSYILLMAQDWTSESNNCVLSLSYDSTRNAQVASLVPITSTMDSKDYTYAIDQLQGYDSTSQSVVIYTPHLQSGRCMISINYKLYMPIVIGADKSVSFLDPSVSDTTDINYDVIYDKFEFTYDTTGVSGCFYVNPTAVDFFSIPIKLERDGITSGNVNDTKRDVIIDTIMSVLSTYDNTPTKMWTKSLITQDSSVIRMTSPSLAAGFDTSYLSGLSYNYIDTLIQYYKTNTLYVDCSEISAGYYGGSIDSSDNWVFTNGTDTQLINMNIVKTNNFYGPGTVPFDTPNKTVKSILVKNITSSFTVNMLPNINGDTLEKPFNSINFYNTNPRQNSSTSVGPWYNLYTRAVHAAIGNSIYAFAYDDVLGQDGTLSGRDTTKFVTATIGELGDMYIPPHKELLHVYAVTLNTNTGFVTNAAGDSCTLRVTWTNPPTTTVPYTQPKNAKYFIMIAASDSTGYNVPATTIFESQSFMNYTDTCGTITLPIGYITGNPLLMNVQVMTCGGPESPDTGTPSNIISHAHGSLILAPNVSTQDCSCSTTPPNSNWWTRLWCWLFGCKDN